MISYTTRPIDVWPGTRTKEPRSSDFSASWGDTRSKLDYELRKLDARNVVLMIDVAPGDLRNDGELRARARPRSAAVILAFDSRYGPQKYACDRFTKWEHNVRAIALGLHDLRRIERYGIAQRGEQYVGWSALPPATVMGEPLSKSAAAVILADLARDGGWVGDGGDIEVDPGEFDVDAVRFAYKHAAQRHHPDHGGDADLFKRATEARDVLMEGLDGG